MPNYARTAANLIGTPAAPATVAPSATVAGTTGAYAAGVDVAFIACQVAIGQTPPGSNPTVQFAYTLDGQNYVNDGGPFTVPIATNQTTYSYSYPVPDAAAGARVTITNGNSLAITAWAQASTRAVS